MLWRRRLACSFCGKPAAEVAKLVAGPRVYICDRCVAEAQRVMNDPSVGMSERTAPSTFWARVTARLAGLCNRTMALSEVALVLRCTAAAQTGR